MRTALALALALTMAGGLAACGSGGNDTSGASTTSGQPGTGKRTVTLGTKNFTEQFVLGQLYKQALEAKGFTVELKQNIGSTEIADKALRSGQIDLYPEYIGIFNTAVAGDDKAYPTVQSAFAAGKAYATKHGFTLLPLDPVHGRRRACGVCPTMRARATSRASPTSRRSRDARRRAAGVPPASRRASSASQGSTGSRP